ncbi:MAG: branched-chain amino acid ABC transporter substrate-binding protein [Candidatus Hydrogenedentes bacterium]|nr:branched-chain amino acid ABC transporter substrate-binding protein [Candidatus Hydrogenedentota bacterium]
MNSRRNFLKASAAAALAVAAAPVRAQDAQPIKIVSSLPHTGSANAQTKTMVNGIQLAIEEAGSKAGGFPLVYEAWDDASPERGQWDPAVEAANADKAVADPNIMAYIGTYNSGAAKIAMPKLNQAGLLMISPGNTWPGLTKPKVGEPNEPMVYRPSKKITYFRVVPADDIQGLVAARWTNEMGAKKVYILHDRELYGQGIATMFQKEAKVLGLDVLGFEGIDPKASNYRSLVTKIKQKRPDLVYFGGTTQTNAGQIAKDLRSANLNVKFMVPDGCFENAFIESAGPENVEGSAFITFGGVPADKLTGKGAEFYENYKKRFGSEPEAYAAYGYECGRVVIDAINRAGKKDRAAIIAATAATKDFDGVLGKWSFDENGDTTNTTMSCNTVKNGKFEFVKVFGQ